MRPAQQGKLWADMLVVLVVVVAFCFLFFGSFLLGHREHGGSHADAQQMAQFDCLNAAVELFAIEFDGYPPSEANDVADVPYGGSMKLAEALTGQDLKGFHSRSIFRADGLDPNGCVPLYPTGPDANNLKLRRGPYVPAENANAFRLADIYGEGNTSPFPDNTLVLCDSYRQMRPSGKRTGMPILYYRANSSGSTHDVRNPDNPQNIYRYQDNQALISLGVPGRPRERHPLVDPTRFYLNTQDRKALPKFASCRPDSFVLISAGPDGLYGTEDDICNFDWKYRSR